MNEFENNLQLIKQATRHSDTASITYALYKDKVKDAADMYVTVKHNLNKDQWKNRVLCFPRYTQEYSFYLQQLVKA